MNPTLTQTAQAQAAKPNQALPPGTPDMYLQAWEEIAAEFGMERFRAGLWRALRKTPFFPAPNEIEDACRELRSAEAEQRRKDDQARRDQEWEEHKARVAAEAPLTDEERSEIEERWNRLMTGSRSKPEPLLPQPVPVTHTIQAAAMDAPGWVRHGCSCGRRWDTFGEVLICPLDRQREHDAAVSAAIAGRRK